MQIFFNFFLLKDIWKFVLLKQAPIRQIEVNEQREYNRIVE